MPSPDDDLCAALVEIRRLRLALALYEWRQKSGRKPILSDDDIEAFIEWEPKFRAEAINAARISGASDDEIRKIEAARPHALTKWMAASGLDASSAAGA